MITEPITYDGQQVTSPLHKDNTQGGVCHALNTDSRNYVVIPLGSDGQAKREHSETEKYKCYAISSYNSGSMQSSNPHSGIYETTISRIEETTYIVRRLTPTECARLQGFPDWWCADVPHADSAEYKLWGNGVALPAVLYVMEGIASILNNEKGEKK